MIETSQYYEMSISHRNRHKCGGYPFENGKFLTSITRETQANRVLEIGTAIGFSAYCFAMASNTIHVDSIDKMIEHKDLALRNWKACGIEDQIDFLEGKSIDVVKELISRNVNKYDIIFFDGFSPNPDEIDHYILLLNPNGLLITTNLKLASEINRVDEYLEKLDASELSTTNTGDTAFSSRDVSSIEKCLELWD